MNIVRDLRISRAIGKGNYTIAIDQYLIYLEKNPDDSYRRSMLALCYFWNNDPRKAIEEAKQVVKFERHDFCMYTLMTKCYFKIEDHASGYKNACLAIANPPGPGLEIPKLISWIPGVKKAVLQTARDDWNDLGWIRKYRKWCEDELGYQYNN